MPTRVGHRLSRREREIMNAVFALRNRALAEEIRERVKREQGIELEYEVELWRSHKPASEKDEPESETEEESSHQE